MSTNNIRDLLVSDIFGNKIAATYALSNAGQELVSWSSLIMFSAGLWEISYPIVMILKVNSSNNFGDKPYVDMLWTTIRAVTATSTMANINLTALLG